MGGDTITGKIEVFSRQPLHCSAVKLKVTGHEKCKFDVLHAHTVQQTDGSSKTIYTKSKAREKKEFFDRSEKSLWSGVIPAEPQEIPFQFPLPRDLPASFHLKGRQGSGERERKWQGRIVYKVKAVLELPQRPDMKAEQLLVMVEPPRSPTKPVKEEKEGSAMCCLCIPRGRISMTANFDRLQVFPGERFAFYLSVRNDSSMDVRATKIKLMRTIRLRADGHTWNLVDSIGETSKFDAVPARKSMEKNVHLDIHSSVEPATTLGRLVQCSFNVNVECDIPFAPDVELHRSLDIVPLRPTQWGSEYSAAYSKQPIPDASGPQGGSSSWHSSPPPPPQQDFYADPPTHKGGDPALDPFLGGQHQSHKGYGTGM